MFAKLVAFRQNEWVGWLVGTIEHWAGGWMAGTANAQGSLLAQAPRLCSSSEIFKSRPDSQFMSLATRPSDSHERRSTSFLLFTSYLSLQWPNLNCGAFEGICKTVSGEIDNNYSCNDLLPEWGLSSRPLVFCALLASMVFPACDTTDRWYGSIFPLSSL